MKVNIQKLLKRFIPLLTVCVILLGCMVSPAFATWGDSDIEVIDYLDYADSDHLVIEDDNKWIVIELPTTYASTSVLVNGIGEYQHISGNDQYIDVDYTMFERGFDIYCSPVSDFEFFVGNRIRNGFVIDISHLPEGSYIDSWWYMDFKSDEVMVILDEEDLVNRVYYQYVGEPDEFGCSYLMGRTDFDGGYVVVGSNYALCQSREYFDSSIGTKSDYVIPVCILDDVLTDMPIAFKLHLSKLTLRIPITDDLLNMAQSEKTQKLLDEVNDQLAEQNKNLEDIINGTPEMNDKVDSAVDDMNNAGEQLEDLGESLNAVEKPDTGNLDVGIDSFLPETSFLAYTAPIRNLWENDTLVGMLIIVLTLVLVSWVFFGKKG